MPQKRICLTWSLRWRWWRWLASTRTSSTSWEPALRRVSKASPAALWQKPAVTRKGEDVWPVFSRRNVIKGQTNYVGVELSAESLWATGPYKPKGRTRKGHHRATTQIKVQATHEHSRYWLAKRCLAGWAIKAKVGPLWVQLKWFVDGGDLWVQLSQLKRLFFLRSTVCDSGVRLERELEGILAGPTPSRHGVLLQPYPCAGRAAFLQRSGVVCLSSCQGHGIPCIQKGKQSQREQNMEVHLGRLENDCWDNSQYFVHRLCKVEHKRGLLTFGHGVCGISSIQKLRLCLECSYELATSGWLWDFLLCGHSFWILGFLQQKQYWGKCWMW